MSDHGNPFRQSLRVLGLYVRGQLLIAAIVTVLYAAGFAIVRAPGWFLLAIVAGALHVIPGVGSIFGLLLVTFVTWLASGSWHRALGVFAVWVVVEAFETFYLHPRILGRTLGLRPLFVFAAVILGSVFLGPIGFFLAVPALAIGAVFWRYYSKNTRVTSVTKSQY